MNARRMKGWNAAGIAQEYHNVFGFRLGRRDNQNAS